MSSTMKSACTMHCFSCNNPIMKGDEITQCIEIGGMDLRGKLFSGARWVHQYCMPTDIMTKFYMDTLDDYSKAYPQTDFDDICTIVDSLDYWIHQKKN